VGTWVAGGLMGALAFNTHTLNILLLSYVWLIDFNKYASNPTPERKRVKWKTPNS